MDIAHIASLSRESCALIECKKANTIVTLMTDEDNYSICEIAYENLGTKNIVVRLNNRVNVEKFQKLEVVAIAAFSQFRWSGRGRGVVMQF